MIDTFDDGLCLVAWWSKVYNNSVAIHDCSTE